MKQVLVKVAHLFEMCVFVFPVGSVRGRIALRNCIIHF